MAWLLCREFKVPNPQFSAGAGARWSDRRSAQRARREGSSESNRTSFQEWGAASPVESHYRVYSCLFAKCVVEMCSEVGSAAGRGGPQRSRGGKENPSRHRQLLKEMISSWLGVKGVRAEEMTKSRKI